MMVHSCLKKNQLWRYESYYYLRQGVRQNLNYVSMFQFIEDIDSLSREPCNVAGFQPSRPGSFVARSYGLRWGETFRIVYLDWDVMITLQNAMFVMTSVDILIESPCFPSGVLGYRCSFFRWPLYSTLLIIKFAFTVYVRYSCCREISVLVRINKSHVVV